MKVHDRNAGNRLMAEFLQWQLRPYNHTIKFWTGSHIFRANTSERIFENKLLFHTSWEWMVAVLDAIEAIKEGIHVNMQGRKNYYTFEITHPDWNEEIEKGYCFATGSNRIEVAWTVAVQFLEWHNAQKNKPRYVKLV